MAPHSPRLPSTSPTSSPKLGSPARLVRHQPPNFQRGVSPAAEGSRPESFMKKMKVWRSHGGGHLDFGCAGEDKSWLQDGPADIGDKSYSSHSRAHSSSSDLSSSTVESSLPPSPTPSCPPILPSFSLLPALSYTSQVPLTPRSERRRGDEERAVEAVHDYFRRVRLSRVDEDTPALVGMGIDVAYDYDNAPQSTYKPLTTSRSEELISPRTKATARFTNSAPVTPRTSTDDLRTRPTLHQPTITFLKPTHEDSPFLEPLPSPIPSTDAEITGVLDELSDFFSSSTISPTTPPKHTRSASHDVQNASPPKRNRLRPRFASDSNIALEQPVAASSPPPVKRDNRVVERRVAYDWI